MRTVFCAKCASIALFYFVHKKMGGEVELDTRVLRETLEGVPLNTYEVIKWIEEYLKEQYQQK